jgi:hypothetical protein
MDISAVVVFMEKEYVSLWQQKKCYVAFICIRRASQGRNNGSLGLFGMMLTVIEHYKCGGM